MFPFITPESLMSVAGKLLQPSIVHIEIGKNVLDIIMILESVKQLQELLGEILVLNFNGRHRMHYRLGAHHLLTAGFYSPFDRLDALRRAGDQNFRFTILYHVISSSLTDRT